MDIKSEQNQRLVLEFAGMCVCKATTVRKMQNQSKTTKPQKGKKERTKERTKKETTTNVVESG